MNLGLWVITGCCAGPEASRPVEEKQGEIASAPMSQSDKLRQKAKIAEAASMVGYDGKAIRRDLDKIIDQQEAAAKQFEDLQGF